MSNKTNDFPIKIIKTFLHFIEKVLQTVLNITKVLNFNISRDIFMDIFTKNDLPFIQISEQYIKNTKVDIEKKKRKKVFCGITDVNMKGTNSEFINIFDNDKFYKMILDEIYKMNDSSNVIKFNSHYSFLYFMKSLNYVKILIDSNVNIIEDLQFKVYLFLLTLIINDTSEFVKNMNLNEGLFKGTFEELKKKYSDYKYNDSDIITNILNKWKKEFDTKLCNFIYKIFILISYDIKEYGDLNDKIINQMYKEVNDIVYEIMNTAKKKNNEITKDLFEKISNFYKNNDYLIFINYSAEINFEGDDIKEKINSSFLQNKENYKYRKYNIEIEDLTKNKDNLEKYLSIKKKYIEKYNYYFQKSLLLIIQ